MAKTGASHAHAFGTKTSGSSGTSARPLVFEGKGQLPGGAFQLAVSFLFGLLVAVGTGVGVPLAANTAEAQATPIEPVADSPQQAGAEFWVDVKVGADTSEVSNLFGTSFALDYDETHLSVVDDEAGSFLGNDVVYSSNNDASAGEIGIGVSRKSGAGGVDGSGVVARVKFEVGSDVSDGTELSFSLVEVEADDPDGNTLSLDPQPLTVQVGQASLPAPTGLSASARDAAVQLSWSAGGDPSPAGYNVYRSTSSFSEVSSATKVNSSSVEDTSFTDEGLSNGTEYFYRVTAVNESGSESAPSNLASATPIAAGTDPPLRPTASSPRSPGAEFWVEVRVGSDEVPVEDLFGISFTLGYDASRLSVASDEAGAFLGEDLVYTSNNDAGAGEIGIGVSQKSGAEGADGTGIVARVKVAVSGDVSDGTELTLDVGDVEARGPDGNSIVLEPGGRTVTISSVPPIEPVADSPQGPGDEFWVGVRVGSDAYSVTDLFGVSFSLDYDQSHLTVTGDEAGNFLGDNVVYSSNNDAGAGQIGIGVTRKSGAGGVEGSGVVARVRFRAGGTAPEGTELSFSLEEVEGDDSGGSALSLRPKEETVTLESPAAEAAASVNGDGRVDFSGTGVGIDFVGTEGSGTVTVQRYDGEPTDPLNISEENRSEYRFVIEPESGLEVGPGTEVRFDADALEGMSSPGEAVVYKRPEPGSGSFTRLETSYDGAAGEVVAQTSSFSEFAFGSNADPLPVEMAKFKATASGTSVAVLTWQTASETENAGFGVQHRPPEGDSWTKIGFVESKAPGGTTTEPQTYRFVEKDLSVGTHQFRLRQIDLDGSAALTDPVSLTLGMRGKASLNEPAPNPVSETTTLSFAVKKEMRATVRVYNTLGQQVRTLYEGRPPPGEPQRLKVDMSRLPSGTYFVRLVAGGQTRVRRLTVVR